MHIKYDKEADALYIKLNSVKTSKTIELGKSFLIDLDKKKNIIGIEILNYSKNTPKRQERFSIITKQSRILIPTA